MRAEIIDESVKGIDQKVCLDVRGRAIKPLDPGKLGGLPQAGLLIGSQLTRARHRPRLDGHRPQIRIVPGLQAGWSALDRKQAVGNPPFPSAK